MTDLIGKMITVYDHRKYEDEPEGENPESFIIRDVQFDTSMDPSAYVFLLEGKDGSLVTFSPPDISDELNRHECKIHW